MPKYRVIVHRRVFRFLDRLTDEKIKRSVVEMIEKLEDYPISLREMDVVAVRGLDRTFRIRIGTYRVIFFVDKNEKTVYVVDVDSRARVYKRS